MMPMIRQARSNREVAKIPSGNNSPSLNSIQSNQIEVTLDEENQYKNLEVVPIPDGNYSRDKDNIQRDSPQITCPGIYKKGACPPHTERKKEEAENTVMNSDTSEKENQCIKVILERENQSKNPSVSVKMGGANDANDTPVFVEAEARSKRELVNPSLKRNDNNIVSGKRKREEERKEVVNIVEKREFNTKYIGESNRSGENI